jgi:hypothetical protein
MRHLGEGPYEPGKDDMVVKITGDYTNGRRGVIIDTKPGRRLVHWQADKNGNPLDVRGWCALRFLYLREFPQTKTAVGTGAQRRLQ